MRPAIVGASRRSLDGFETTTKPRPKTIRQRLGLAIIDFMANVVNAR